jgi:endonuclease/exonuclease/phosphatase family metal-dependent hydrolase
MDPTTMRARTLIPIALLVLAHALARGPVRAAFGCGAVDGPDTDDAELVVLSWNLCNFPGKPGPGEHARGRIAERIAATAPHVLAVQEIHDAEALAELVPGLALALSEHGGSHGQRLGIAIDARTRMIAPLFEHRALEIGGRVRPAVSSYLRTAGGIDFHLVVVHLKATPDGAELRRLQWALLADAIARVRVVGPGSGDPDIIVIGDFNPTGHGEVSAADERAALGEVLAPLGLHALPIDGDCSAYWDGARHDGWLEPTLLDLVFIGGFDERDAWRATPLGACAAHGCSALRSTAAHPDPQVVGMSDHCGVLVQLDRE